MRAHERRRPGIDELGPRPGFRSCWSSDTLSPPRRYPYCVDYDLVPTLTAAPDAWWEPLPGERWANARVGHAAALLRHVFEHRDEARDWGRRLQSHVRETFSEAPITRRLIDALDGKE